jgi:hypothetical protein
LGFGGGTYNLQSGSNVNAATFALSGGGVNISGSYSATATSINGTANFIPGAVVSTVGALTISSVRANFNTGALVPIITLTFNGGELSGTDAVTVSGQATWNSGTMSGTGATTFNGNATITANGNIQNLVGGRTLNIVGTLTFSGNNGDFRPGSSATTINIFGVWLDQTTGTTGIGNPFGGSADQATIRNTGTFRKTGSATTNIASVFNNISPGVVDVQAGTLNLTNGGTQSGDFLTAAGATLHFNGGTFNINTLSVSSLRVVSTTVNVLGTLTVGGLLEVLGSGTLNVTGQVNANSYSQNGGTLSGTGSLTVSGQATWTSGTMSGTGTTTFNGNATITANGNIQNLVGGRKLNLAGTTTFDGANGDFRTGSNVTTINNSGIFLDQTTGTTRIASPFGGSADQATFNNTGTLRKTGSATTTIISVFNNSGTVDIQSGSLAFTVAYTQTAGETKLNGGALSSSTTLTLQGGKLTGTGTVTANVSNAALVSPGASPGQLTISGSYTQTSVGALNVEIGGLTAETEFDRLAISGSATLSGTLNVSLINGFLPNPGDSFQIMTFASRSGSFTTINGLDLGGGRSFQVNLTGTSLSLVTPP